MGFSGFRGGVLRAILRWRRGANGAFYRGIPGFLGGVRYGKAIQRTADTGGRSGRKNF